MSDTQFLKRRIIYNVSLLKYLIKIGLFKILFPQLPLPQCFICVIQYALCKLGISVNSQCHFPTHDTLLSAVSILPRRGNHQNEAGGRWYASPGRNRCRRPCCQPLLVCNNERQKCAPQQRENRRQFPRRWTPPPGEAPSGSLVGTETTRVPSPVAVTAAPAETASASAAATTTTATPDNSSDGGAEDLDGIPLVDSAVNGNSLKSLSPYSWTLLALRPTPAGGIGKRTAAGLPPPPPGDELPDGCGNNDVVVQSCGRPIQRDAHATRARDKRSIGKFIL